MNNKDERNAEEVYEKTINSLAQNVVNYLLQKGLNHSELQPELEAVMEIILSGEEINLAYLNFKLKEQDERFVELDDDVFAEILAFMRLQGGIQFSFDSFD